MWVKYMQEVLDLGNESWRVRNQQQQNQRKLVTALSHGAKLVSADFHGAEVEVVRSRCFGRVGLKGVVVRDTKFTFVVVTEKDEVKSEFPPVLSFCLLF
jgi:ribonuclease P protein subunit POP4